MSKTVKLKILIDFKDKENGKKYKRNDKIMFTEKRAEELLKNPCLVEKIDEVEEQEENKTEKTEKQTDNKTEK